MAWQLKNKRLQSVGASSSIANPAHSITAASASSASNHLQLHLDTGDDMVRQSATSQTDTQKTTFMRWVNVQLATTAIYGPMSTIERDFRDGKRLIGLLEVISKEPLKPERGNMRIHQMANVSKALSFLEKRTNEPLGSIGNEDIVDGNVKLTLGLIWIIIYRFQIQQIANTMGELYPSMIEDMNNMESEESSNVTIIAGIKLKKKGASQHQVDAKQALLRWVRYELEDYSDIIPPIQDFHRSWKTGLAFAALIHRHDPHILPDFYNSILQVPHENIDQWRSTLTTAFDAAFEKMAVPRLLDPEDLIDMETPDERSVMTYVSEYYLIMSKLEREQDPAKAEELHAQRVQAKEERLTVAVEDQQVELLRVLEEEEIKKREEQEELERIRLRRMEIEGWSIRAAERAREEEEARRKRKEEEEEKSRQRQLRREQREREQAKLLQKARPHRRTLSSASFSLPEFSFHEEGEPGLPRIEAEAMDPEELQRRREELDSKLELYMQQTTELLAWLARQEEDFPMTPDTAAPLDRTKDMEPFKQAIEKAEERRLKRENELVPKFHSAREELLDFESPELTSEQVAEVDRNWWSIDASINTLRQKTAKAKDALQEMQWILECSQEIDRILTDIQRFEDQLRAAAEKRSQDTLTNRAQLSLLDHQDSNLFSIRVLLKKYADILSTLLDSNTYTPPEHLTQSTTDICDQRLSRLHSDLDSAQHDFANDRLLRAFLSTLDLSEEWVLKSAEWLASLKEPSFVSEDVWKGGDSLKGFLARDQAQDENLEQLQSEMDELKVRLEEEQTKVAEFRANELVKLEEDSQAVIKGMEETHDTTTEDTTKAVQDMMEEFTDDLKRIEVMLPKEQGRCVYAMRVLDYLFSMRATLSHLESAFNAVNSWVITQPGKEVEAAVRQVEASRDQLETTFKAEDVQPVVWESIQIRHAAFSNLVRDLRATFDEKQDILKANQQMKAFLELTGLCQTALREFRAQLWNDAPFKGFVSKDATPFEEYEDLVEGVGQSFDEFESAGYVKYQEAADAMVASASSPGSRQDLALIQTKIASVHRLLSDIKALRADRERDVTTITECRRVAGKFQTLGSELESLESRFTAFEITDPDQRGTLNELIERSNQLANEIVLLEQGIIYRYVARDPSCIPMLKEIRDRQTNIQQMQARLQSGLEIGEQWELLWDQFTDRVRTLQQYLDGTEKSILDRRIATIDGLADGEENWKKSEDELHEAEDANNQTLANLKEFQKQRMLELSNLKVALYQSVQQSGGIESLDQIRAKQYHEAEQLQQNLKVHLQRLYTLNSQEGFQLEILGQRLVWSQQLATSKTEVEGSIVGCTGIVEEFTQLLTKCGDSSDTSYLNTKAAEQLQQQMHQISATTATQKETTFDVTLTIYGSLAELATTPAPGESPDNAAEKKIPLHLEVELYEFKNQYNLLDLHLEYARQVVDHAGLVIEHVRKIDSMDSGFLRMATELKAEKEADRITLEKLDAIRTELEELTEEVRVVTKMPRPADKIADAYQNSGSSQPRIRVELERALKQRLEKSRELSRALDPLLIEFKALLAYQDGLRKLTEELNEHDRWVTRSGQKVQLMQDQIRQMFKSWPGDELEQLKAAQHNAEESMVVFDVDEQVVVDELDVLIVEMDREFAYVQHQKQGYQQSKQKVELALCGATAHSKQLQMELEWYVDNLARKIQQLETDIRTKSLQLQALEKRAVWEKEIEVARSWFKDFAKAVILFAREQVKWRANHREFDDAASMRSVRTTASRMQIDRLGLSVIEFEDQVEIFETESRPRVDKAWSELCSALVFIARSIPDEFQRRQTALWKEFEEIRKQVTYSAQIVTQRKSLEEVALKLEELEGLKGENGESALSIMSGRTGLEIKSVKTKGKGWSRFQAKVKKLTRR
ncbi:actinin alpha 2 [Gamsiella multidivaricata]|nr:actinin alpha 2 [Gamsiella multidivaricata]